MPFPFVTLPATGSKIGSSLITTFNGAADAGGAYSQMSKIGWGLDGTYNDVTDATPLPVKTLQGGVISTTNSSAVALGISGVFTGTAEDVTEYADVRIFVVSDQASAVDGLQIQQSSNGTNWDVSDPYSIPAATGKIFSIGVSAKFFRIVYTNGTTAQTAFRLQVKLGKVHSRPSSVRPQDGRGNDNDMDEVLGHLMSYNGTSWDRMRGSIANGLAVDVVRIQSTVNVAGTRNNNGTGTVAGSFHLTAGGSDGTNLRPLSVDSTGRLNTNAILAAETTKIIGTVNQGTAATLANGWTAKLTDGTNSVGVTSAALAGNETTNDRLKVNASMRVLDTSLAVGAQLVAARGDQTTGLWVNVKNASTAVTGTFFQATQPISAVSLPLPTGAATDGTDITAPTAMPAGGVGTRGWLSAIWTKLNGSLAVTGAFFQATQPVSAASLPLPAGAATDASLTNHTLKQQAVITLTVLSVANTTATLTLPAVAAQFHYITRIEIVRVATAAVAGTAVLGYTSSNISGAWARSAGNAIAAGGTVKDVDEWLSNPIKSTVLNTATTIVAPAAGAAVQTRITAYYYTAA